jgi:putative membrane protein
MDASFLIASLHHLLAFGMIGTLAAEFSVLRNEMDALAIRLIGRLDIAYGAFFVLLLGIGLVRAWGYEKGWDYYANSYAFWGKLGLYLAAAAFSVPPTLTFLRWRSSLAADTGFRPGVSQVQRLRRLMGVQVVLLVGVPVFAAMMARGLGQMP